MIEPRRRKGEVQICGLGKKKKVAVVADEPQIAAWKDKWDNSKVQLRTRADNLAEH